MDIAILILCIATFCLCIYGIIKEIRQDLRFKKLEAGILSSIKEQPQVIPPKRKAGVSYLFPASEEKKNKDRLYELTSAGVDSNA